MLSLWRVDRFSVMKEVGLGPESDRKWQRGHQDLGAHGSGSRTQDDLSRAHAMVIGLWWPV